MQKPPHRYHSDRVCIHFGSKSVTGGHWCHLLVVLLLFLSNRSRLYQRGGFANLPNSFCKSAKIKVAERKRHNTFLCSTHFYCHEQHLFFCVNPLLLCYRVPNMGRVAIF